MAGEKPTARPPLRGLKKQRELVGTVDLPYDPLWGFDAPSQLTNSVRFKQWPLTPFQHGGWAFLGSPLKLFHVVGSTNFLGYSPKMLFSSWHPFKTTKQWVPTQVWRRIRPSDFRCNVDPGLITPWLIIRGVSPFGGDSSLWRTSPIVISRGL